MTYVKQLAAELSRCGIRGRLRGRILAEISDHLACDPNAELGDPAVIAKQFADELGSVRARRAAFAAFGALAVAGGLFAVAFMAGTSGFPHRHPQSALVGAVGGALAILGPQVAFVAGMLGALRALRRRGARVLPRAEAIILARRAAVGLVAGLVAMSGLALLAIEYRQALPASETTFALIAAAAGALALLAAAPALLSAARLRPLAEGSAGDIFNDLGALVPASLRGRHWRLAITVAVAVAVAVAFAGALQNDPYDGALRGILDGLGCVAGFAVLGRYLGLRSSTS